MLISQILFASTIREKQRNKEIKGFLCVLFGRWKSKCLICSFGPEEFEIEKKEIRNKDIVQPGYSSNIPVGWKNVVPVVENVCSTFLDLLLSIY